MKDIRMISIPDIKESIFSCRCIDRNPSLYEYEIIWQDYDSKHDDGYCRRCGKGLFTRSDFKRGYKKRKT